MKGTFLASVDRRIMHARQGSTLNPNVGRVQFK
jgi:hypothetical protein